MLSSVQPSEKICNSVSAKFGKRKLGAVFKSMFAMVESEVLQERWIDKVRPVRRTALSVIILC